MQPHSPPQALCVILITCPTCNGTEHYDSHGESCACHFCQSGYQSIALPLWDVLAIHDWPEPDHQTALMDLVAKTQPVRHHLLYNSVDVPTKYQPLLKPNPSDSLPRPKNPLQ